MHDTLAAAPSPDFAERLARLARVAVRVGLNLQPGQQLILTAPIESLDLARAITREAYAAGASLVTPLYSDTAATLARYETAPDEAFDVSTGWLFDGMAAAFQAGAARLHVSGEDPNLLEGQDPDRVSRANRARSVAYRPAMTEIVNFNTNWSIVSGATPQWARLVFPELTEAEALARLWDAIFSASRVDEPDPVAAWEAHNAALRARVDWLDGHRFAALRFRGGDTDLTVGLADDHAWSGGRTLARNGVPCNANVPTEEVFTTPHRERTEGRVVSTKPLSYQGTLIEGIDVRFEGGRVVSATATRGAATLARMLDSDEGARRLGEVALVPASSPISASGLLFSNTLFDENAASHIALGQSYAKCFRPDVRDLGTEALAARGANESLIHVDWMIGSPRIDVDGIAADGTAVPVMRAGEWA